MATQPYKRPPTNKDTVTATFSTAATGLSDVIDLGGYAVHGIQMSTTWNAAVMTFLGSANSSANLSAVVVTTACVELAYNSSASTFMAIDPTPLRGLRFLQLRSGTAGIPVAQSSAASVVLSLNSFEPTRG